MSRCLWFTVYFDYVPSKLTFVINRSLCIGYLVICVSDGVMYWGDASLYTVESAYINGTGRSVYGVIYGAYYIAFLFRDDNIYITAWTSPYVCLFSPSCTVIQTTLPQKFYK